MLRLNRLLYTTLDGDVFYDRIQPTQEQRNFLVRCKNEIRDHLRPRIRQATVAVLGMEKAVEPRFRTQGSWSYSTCVQPAHTPPQQMDWDYGVYLPVHVWEENGPPRAMAKAYFDLVESLLQDLRKKKGWEINGGKNTCIRVDVSDWAHIDIPLYAAPEEKFLEVLEKAIALEGRQVTAALDSAYLAEDAEQGELPEQAWEDLDEIVLATRTGEWKPSDPEAVSRWFNDRVAVHGPQLRRVSRYLKAWRDFHWNDGGGPSSVSIMIAVGQAFEPQLRRDDLALEKAAAQLAKVIQGELREVAIDDGAVDFNGGLSADEKIAASEKARTLASTLYRARSYSASMKDEAVKDLRNQFGPRMPNRPELVEADDGPEAVRSVPAERVPAPVVKATSAG